MDDAQEQDGQKDTAPVRRGGRPPRNASEPDSIKATEARLAKDAEQRDTDLRELMRLPHFRRYVWRWIGRSGMFRRPRTLNAEGYVLQGRAEVGLEMWNELTHATPEAVIEMMRTSMTQENA